MTTQPLVLVTGASGFVAGHACLALLASGKFRVRGTVRSLSNTPALAHLRTHDQLQKVELVEADLLGDKGWDEAMRGVSFLMHVASPFPIGKVEPGSLVKPAVEGTERVLRAAAAGGVKRVVLTSSVAAISSGRAPDDNVEKTFTEADWSNAERADEYPKSKTLAERRAWELAAEVRGAKIERRRLCHRHVLPSSDRALVCRSPAAQPRARDDQPFVRHRPTPIDARRLLCHPRAATARG